LDGAVTRLSPYISRGVISTHFVYDSLLQQNFDFPAVEKLVQELAWRDYWQLIWVERQAAIEADLRSPQLPVVSFGLPVAFQTASTFVEAIDAGIQKLYSTGYMHNRVRMIVASFLTKHLLIDWRWGEAYFAKKLLDFDLAANNGGWQWAAGSGCDAAPYFRVFNPYLQTQKFDPDLHYIRRWVPEFEELTYARPIVEHDYARKRCLEVYAKALKPA